MNREADGVDETTLVLGGRKHERRFGMKRDARPRPEIDAEADERRRAVDEAAIQPGIGRGQAVDEAGGQYDDDSIRDVDARHDRRAKTPEVVASVGSVHTNSDEIDVVDARVEREIQCVTRKDEPLQVAAEAERS